MYNMVSSSKKWTTPKVKKIYLSLLNNKNDIEPHPYDYGCYYLLQIKLFGSSRDLYKKPEQEEGAASTPLNKS